MQVESCPGDAEDGRPCTKCGRYETAEYSRFPCRVASLDERMKAAGMFTIDEMLSVTPLIPFTIQVGMDNLQFFEEWLDRRVREFLKMRVQYELGDKEKDDLYEWVLAHAATLMEVRANFKAAIGDQT
jgi:hypothetical protein